jgi:hypothetical protein
MVTTEMRDDVSGGEIAFDQTVTREEILKFVEALEEGADGDKYFAMYIRKRDQRSVLGFMYGHKSSDSTAHSRFYYKITDMLKRRFGNKCTGWSISTPIDMVTIENM